MTAALTKGRQQLHYRHRGPGAELRDRHPRELADRPQSNGSGSGRCGAIDSEVPVATREIQRRNDQEEGCPSVDAVREAHEARGGLDTATGNMRDPEAAEVAVHHWVAQ